MYGFDQNTLKLFRAPPSVVNQKKFKKVFSISSKLDIL